MSQIAGRAVIETAADELTSTELAFVQGLSGLSYVNGDLLYYNGTTLTNLAIGINGDYLRIGTGGIPEWTALTGAVTGPSSSTDNAIPKYDGAGGATLLNTGLIIDDSNNLTGVGTITASGVITAGGNMLSDTDDNDDLGSSTKEWKNLYVDGVAYMDEIDMEDNEKIKLGIGDDAQIYFNATDLVIITDGAGASGIILDSEDDTVEIKGSGSLQATFDTGGLNLVSGDAYEINGTSVLNATTLGANVVASSLTSVGTLTSLTLSGTITGATDITASGTVQGGTIYDGTLSIASGSITSAVDITASGTAQAGTLYDGTMSIASGSLTSVVDITASGTVQAGTLYDGTLSAASGSITSAVDITASGTVQAGTLTDGAFSVASGAITGATTVGCGAITSTGAVQGTSLVSDTISEKTATAGVTIDSLKIKDGIIDQIGAIEDILLNSDKLYWDILGWQSKDGYSITTGASATVTLYGVSLIMETGATQDSLTGWMPVTKYAKVGVTGKKVIVEWTIMNLSSITNQTIQLIVSRDNTIPVAETVDNFGFKIVDEQLNSITTDSSDTQESQDTTVNMSTGAQLTSLKAVWNPGTDVKFYVNGVLKTTHSTNIPSNTSTGFIAVTINNDAAEDKQITCGSTKVIIEK